MLLEKLVDLSRRLELPPTLYSSTPIRYIVELDVNGRPLSGRLTDTSEPKNPRMKMGEARYAPVIQRSSAIRPLLLADRADYALGYVGQGDDSKRVGSCHKAFLDLTRRCAAETGDRRVEAVVQFLSGQPLGELELGEVFDPSAKITFRVEGELLIDLPVVQAFWAAENDPELRSAPLMQCLVCGETRPVVERLQGKIRGVPGGQPSGTSIISANKEAFLSYGLKASLVAPTCAVCGERFTKSINHLLADPSSRIVLGGSAFVFWTRDELEFSLINVLSNPSAEDVRLLLDSVRTGRYTPEVDDSRFYGAVLSGSGGRAVVRDWLDTTVGNVKRHLAYWFQRQMIVGPWGEAPQPRGLYSLAASTVRDAADLEPPTTRALLRTALAGALPPPNLLYQAVRRNRAEQRVTSQRAALIKLMLLANSSLDGKEDELVELNDQNTRPAYLCGRLLAVLEEAQYSALGKATIVDRFFGTASAAPASVFGRLVRGAQPHLAKLERDRPPAYFALQSRLEGILIGLDQFPRILTLEDQGLFALGYYHQRARDRASARQAAANRQRAAGDLAANHDEEQRHTDSKESEE